MSLYCKHCNTGDHLISIPSKSTSVAELNVSQEDRTVYKCENCEGTGTVEEEFHGQFRTRTTGCIVENGGESR